MMDTYRTPTELRLIADLCEIVENAIMGTDISVGSIDVYDANGELLGYIRESSGGSYSLHDTREDEDL